MKYYIKFLPVLFLSLITAGCESGNKQDSNSSEAIIHNPEYSELQSQETLPFQFKLMDSLAINFPDDFILSGFYQLLTGPDGNIYFMDPQQSKLISVSSNGELRWTTGEKGRGPGDFENAYSMITDGNHLFIGNLQGARLDVFNYEGSFIKSHNMVKDINFGTLQGFLDSGELVIATPIWDSWGPHIFLVDISGDSLNISDDFLIDQAGEVETAEGITSRSSITVYQNKIYTGSVTDYSLKTHDKKGNLEKNILRNFDKIVRPGMLASGEFRSIRSFGSVDAPKFLPDGRFIVTASWPANVSDPDRYMQLSSNGNAPEVEYENTLDLYNPEGTLLYSFEHEGSDPEIGSIQHIDKNGIVYTVTLDPNPMIFKYQIVDNK